MLFSKKSIFITLSSIALALSVVTANAETRITYKSAKSTNTFAKMAET